ncbi:MAG: orotidine-5'-phosphate decarboxylase [Gammaproteobacteria bacterium]|jgi:orotidine-5'-phosphate decarboxylase
MTESTDPPLIVALDFPNEQQALATVAALDPARCRVKVGKELFTRCGPPIVERLVRDGFDVFLDLKFHDIPNTVAAACAAAADLGCWMINVHASGGRAMMEAAAERLSQLAESPLLIAVTVLTSMDDAAIREIGFEMGSEELVVRLARLAQTSGMDGVVSSPRELDAIRGACGQEFVTVTPGVRPASAAANDQKRVATPAAARAAGASYLVVGRPVTQAADPAAAVEAIITELESAPNGR